MKGIVAGRGLGNGAHFGGHLDGEAIAPGLWVAGYYPLSDLMLAIAGYPGDLPLFRASLGGTAPPSGVGSSFAEQPDAYPRPPW
jgi:hypothetical protein